MVGVISEKSQTNSSVLADYACFPAQTKGRLFEEQAAIGRTVFQRDRDRILHSGAFRKLQYKTQVFVYHEGDYYRTRLTHSIEVAQIARSLSRALSFNEDLSEAIALSHDLGHTPFGHAGEEALNEMMAPFGGFDHNEQTLRILIELERRYAQFNGLNLTWESLEGVIKHNGPIDNVPSKTVSELANIMKFDLQEFGSGEAQLAGIADDVAYNAHDIDDGLRAGIFKLEDLGSIKLVAPLISDIQEKCGDLEFSRMIHELSRRIVNKLVADILAETSRRITQLNPETAQDIRKCEKPVVGFSTELSSQLDELRDFLFSKMYRHYKVNRMASKARRVIRELFQLFISEPDILPNEWRATAGPSAEPMQARLISDYIAGMTDRYALLEYERLFDPKAKV